MKLHLCPLLLLMNFALNYSVAGIDFRFFKKRNLSYRYFGTSRIILWKNNLGAHKVGFAAFFCAIKNWWEKPCVSHVEYHKLRI